MRNLRTIQAARLGRRNRGFSLVELAMVLAIIALLVAGIMLFFSNASQAAKTNDAMTELAAIQQTVRSLYAGQPAYTGLTAAQVGASGQLPNKWTNGGTTVIDPFGSTVTFTVVTTNTAGDSFSVELAGVPQAACNKMLTMDMGTGVLSLKGTAGSAVVGRGMTPAEAEAACSSQNANTPTWTFQ